MATESLADVLAVMRVASPQLAGFADRLAAAHAAELAERDARIAELESAAAKVRLELGAIEGESWADACAVERCYHALDAAIEQQAQVGGGTNDKE